MAGEQDLGSASKINIDGATFVFMEQNQKRSSNFMVRGANLIVGEQDLASASKSDRQRANPLAMEQIQRSASDFRLQRANPTVSEQVYGRWSNFLHQ